MTAHLTRVTKPIKERTVIRSWHSIDAADKVLGRLTPDISIYLQGKHKVYYVPYIDCGDYVVVINAGKVAVTGGKEDKKVYSRYSGYPGGLKQIRYKDMKTKKPEEIIRHAVYGMLPKNKLRDTRMARFFIFKDEKHPYQDKFKIKNQKHG